MFAAASVLEKIMSPLSLTLSTRDYDYVAGLATGDVKIRGVDLNFVRVYDSRVRVLSDPAVQGGEMSLSEYIRKRQIGDRRFVGLPIFVRRSFRHRCYFTRRGSGISDVTGLVGKQVGVDGWSSTSAIWARAILSDQKVKMADIFWTTGKFTANVRQEKESSLTSSISRTLNLTSLGPQESLIDKLLAGELDAVISPTTPPGLTEEDSRIVHLYEDPRAQEEQYYKRTGFYPMLHIVVLRRDIVDAHPSILRAVFEAFEEARNLAQHNRLKLADTSPWSQTELKDTIAVMGRDYKGVNGIKENALALRHFAKEMEIQGIIDGPIDPEIIFEEFERFTGLD
jgi:4,5-dihydroxyphthalate decarboxylase